MPQQIRDVPHLPPRESQGHKGTFGRVLILAGSRGMAGAPSLVALAALRAGAGLVTVAVPRSIQTTVAAICPCATTLGLAETQSGMVDFSEVQPQLLAEGWLTTQGRGSRADALIVGPGLGAGSKKMAHTLWALIDAFRIEHAVPTVIDADALNMAWLDSSSRPEGWNARAHPNSIFTPHPGELARMKNVSAGEIQQDRQTQAIQTVEQLNQVRHDSQQGPVLVLKGAGTIVADEDRIFVNTTGNPGMATGGSGDVLSGIIGGLLAQGMSTFDAAVAAVYLHGLAGNIAADDVGQVSLIATDLLDTLPRAIQQHGCAETNADG